MSEFILTPYEDKILLELVTDLTHEKYSILCSSKEQAHEIKLSLILDTLVCPKKAPELYTKINDFIYAPKDIAFRDEVESLSEEELNCCQSGCPGCPYYKGIKN